jgi:hypothetical protein
MKMILLKIKSYFAVIFAAIFVIVTFIGIFTFIFYLKKQKKKLQIKPTFKIVDAKIEDTSSMNSLEDAIDVAKDILEKAKG